MGKKCLVTYSSYTGNTEKVAKRFKETFENRGWQCDIFKVRKNADDILRPPFDIRGYDFLCIGSGLGQGPPQDFGPHHAAFLRT